MKYHSDLDRWIVAYIREQLQEGEKEKLEAWLEESPRNRELFQKLCDERVWRDGVARIRSYDAEMAWQLVVTKRERRKRRWRLRRVSVAAVVICTLGAGALAWWKMPAKPEGPVLASIQGVRLNTATGKSFQLDSAQHIVTGGLEMRNDGRQLIVKPGARQTEEQKLQWNTIEVPRGADYSMLLSDGTEIFLNAETRLRFPDRFRPEGKREVWLEGEAYFKVSSDSLRPFIVHSRGMSVRVLGTVFNVMSYQNMPQSQITLVSGKVEVSEEHSRQQLILSPGSQAVYDKRQEILREREVDVSYYTAWQQGIFAFRETPLEEVMETLARWYDFEPFFANAEIREYVYTGKVKRHASLKEVLEHFTRTGELDFEVNDKTVIIRKKS